MTPGRKDNDKGTGRVQALGGETLQLVVDYVKQETLQPLKGLGRFIVFGVAGSVALGIGLVIAAIGLLRVLQAETGSTFTGKWSWAPYLICMVAVVLVAALAVSAVSRGQGRRQVGRDKETA